MGRLISVVKRLIIFLIVNLEFVSIMISEPNYQLDCLIAFTVSTIDNDITLSLSELK
jgi:hypothetical protein